MSDSITLVNFEGAITFGTIEMLLSKLRNSQEFHELNKPTRKRLYGIFVESIDNIYKYGCQDNRYHIGNEIVNEFGRMVINRY